MDTMRVRAEISEADIVKVKPGLPLYFTILGEPDHRHTGHLAFIEPAPESITSDSSFSTTSSSSASSSSTTTSAIYYNGLFDVPNPDGRLRTYMTAEVHIVLGSVKNALTIPSTALEAKNGDGSYSVRVVESDGSLKPRTVTIGLNDKVTAQVLSGISAGERVVTGELATTGAAKSMGSPPPMGM
ncbi:MAG: hypothetical protein B7Z15_16500 [Rhizobiales bacterium 32-66-8]|nr:MAG: hypothetical protein B7Z15_16500 [Rhizobiales bacterium 32-66-8]